MHSDHSASHTGINTHLTPWRLAAHDTPTDSEHGQKIFGRALCAQNP